MNFLCIRSLSILSFFFFLSVSLYDCLWVICLYCMRIISFLRLFFFFLWRLYLCVWVCLVRPCCVLFITLIFRAFRHWSDGVGWFMSAETK
ncbi:hypothetical protein BO85DRAFT_36769 [Aspergillus piperis CBS 112811]|uniref:Uncharacterized protein n=1 Tax=Aspergillus piperis CBS 112811 TaxID=1448313 RepID=A0A8G1VLZ4_9EURO|nr:hypothetical protein BO85DRAFT_36769 [Aspergillus piperis CBS 112811]RAH57260.1 hypothetical protein BO85DRAFT_36769 [Aspergillus piperis CBS 112811]